MNINNNHLLPLFFSLLTASSTLIADQTSEMSIFQPIKNISANIYIDQSKLIIKTDKQHPTSLVNIKPDYVTLYPNQLYILNDKNRDGVIEVSALRSVNASLNEFCYSVYNYNLDTQVYENSAALISCQKGMPEQAVNKNRNIAIAE
ncbi:MAG TPA: hypothetical protein ENJ33_01540 [Thiothrix sp.]|nr:hypothetical protein [Thiothrix sp.]